jgi:Xaa-Pro aminopeptidase
MVNQERADRIRTALAPAGLNALICSLPKNVLMLSGYWPVIGTSVAVAFEDGTVEVIVPEDETELAGRAWAERIHSFQPASLDKLISPSEALVQGLAALAERLNGMRIGIEEGENSEPATYAAMNLYNRSLFRSIARALPAAVLIQADDLLENLRSIKTEIELEGIRKACFLTRYAFEKAVSKLRPGIGEFEAAENFRFAFIDQQTSIGEHARAEAFFWAMSGANSALAHGAYARSRSKRLAKADLVLIHCNTCVDGYWTDITRTFSVGDVKDQREDMYRAIFEARALALQTIAPGRKAYKIDSAARTVLERLGFGKEFKHSTGHGVGFDAISPNALPRIHPKSDDILAPGMVVNVEPAIYFDSYGGIRHCEMVAVTQDGFELLTDFCSKPEDLILAGAEGRAQSAS